MLQVAINNSRPQCNPKINRSSTKPGFPKHSSLGKGSPTCESLPSGLRFGLECNCFSSPGNHSILSMLSCRPVIGGYLPFIGSPTHALFWLLQLPKVSEYLRISISQNISELVSGKKRWKLGPAVLAQWLANGLSGGQIQQHLAGTSPWFSLLPKTWGF
jgi:hypothetical protein